MAQEKDNQKVDPWTFSLISTIENWWGVELTKELAAKAAAAPSCQIQTFLDHLWSSDLAEGSPALPPMGRGTLRPLVSGNPAGMISNDNVSVALRTLLYAHEVVVDCDFIYSALGVKDQSLTNLDRQLIEYALRELVDIRPFIDQGILFIAPVVGDFFSDQEWEIAAVQEPEIRAIALELSRQNQRLTAYSLGEEQIDDAYLALILHMFHGTMKVAFRQMALGTANPLMRTDADRKLVNVLLAAEKIHDQRHYRLDTPARLPVPNFVGDADLLLRLRNSDDQFGQWRDKLGSALDTVADLRDSADLEQASDIVRTELESAYPGVQRSIVKSTMLNNAQKGFIQFGVGAVSAVSAAMITGNPTAGLIGAASSQLANFAINSVKELGEKRKDRLMVGIAASFNASDDIGHA
ncbi:hypothetical protein KL864_23020 [Mycolicibacterium goodii]|uniref:hypothetical protein n=1 Tax=Mycolicibacterium goodii TaxID=134601 RepID=UPI001BDBFD32|nr:hypothetical protein [Mycolicibacterium goodii]MBU8818771.1 hypothetical protein [Mycolicibacterium goodii]